MSSSFLLRRSFQACWNTCVWPTILSLDVASRIIEFSRLEVQRWTF